MEKELHKFKNKSLVIYYLNNNTIFNPELFIESLHLPFNDNNEFNQEDNNNNENNNEYEFAIIIPFGSNYF